MLHMEIAHAELGIRETAGPDATSEILAYFREVGREDITSDEVAWCGAVYGACIARAGIEVTVPRHRRLLARAYLEQGVPIEAPRYGCGVILARPEGGPEAGHVGFVTGWTATEVMVLGGNQANSVSIAAFPRARVLGYRWLIPEQSVADVKRKGSRTINHAVGAERDAVKGGLTGGSGPIMPAPKPGSVAEAADLAGQASSVKGIITTLQDFVVFGLSHWPWIAGSVALYYGLRIIWRQQQIKLARLEDENTGRLVRLPVHEGAHDAQHG